MYKTKIQKFGTLIDLSKIFAITFFENQTIFR
jgi:hypothetical protein